MAQLEDNLEALCELFEDELERQENVLALCVAQGKAARLHDVENLEAKSAALEVLIQEAAGDEKGRLELVAQVVAALELPVERQTLTGLIAVAPEPWAGRMRDFQTRIRQTLEETRRVVKENNRWLRRSLRVVNDVLGALVLPGPAASGSYDSSGSEQRRFHAVPSMIDRRG